MRKFQLLTISFLLLNVNFTFSQLIRNSIFSDTIPEKEISFIIQDKPALLLTMRQSNENFLSIYRLTINEINKTFSFKKSMFAQLLLQSIFFMPLTHEEGHRSILTNEDIGSISRPYFNKNLAAYVTGVTDQTLIDLRTNNIPVAVRTYTGGLESDYNMLLREKSLINFGQESMKVLWIEYFLRKFSMVSYYSIGLLKYNVNLKLEANELNQDIAGMDVYGAIRALHNPSMSFKRYVDYDDLLIQEKHFVKRVGWRSLINLVDPTLFMLKSIRINNNSSLNFNLGYSMSPFGDFIDEHFWIKTTDLNIHTYFRQFQNRTNWFPAFGLDVNDFNLFKELHTTIMIHGWKQPTDLIFYEKESDLGGAVDLLFKYRLKIRQSSPLAGISLNLGMIAKTKGFLPEEIELDKHLGIRLGASIWLKN